jgi:hypothetical protein
MTQQPERERSVLPFPTPASTNASEPMLRMFGEIASWSLGQPLAAGSDDPLIQARRSGIDALVRNLGGDGFRALLAILDHALPVRHEDGTAHLELPGYSAKWLQENVPGLGTRASYRVSNLLQDYGLIVTSAMPGARGSEGKQRAIVSPSVIGLADDVDDVIPIRRSGGRRPRTTSSTEPQTRAVGVIDTSANTSSSTDAQTGEHDQFAGPSKVSSRDALPQVSTHPTVPRTGAPSSESGSPSSLPSEDDAEASPGVNEMRFLLPKAADGTPSDHLGITSWARLRDALNEVERNRPGALAAALQPIFRPVAGNAGALAKTLGLPEDGDRPVSDRVARYVAAVLLSHGGRTSSVWATLANAKVHIPADAPVEQMAPRLLASICAGMDTKVSSWVRWLASALRKPVSEWTHTTTADALRRVLGELLTPDSPAPESTPTSAGPAYQDSPASSTSHEPAESTPEDTSLDAGPRRTLVLPEMPRVSDADTRRPAGQGAPPRPAKATTPPPSSGLPPEIEEHLVAAVAWGGEENAISRKGIEALRERPGMARALVATYLEALKDLE